MAVSTIFQQRVSQLQEVMLQQGVDAFLASTPVNMLYLSGFQEPPLERLMFLLIPRDQEPCWLVPALSAESAEGNPAGWQVRYRWHDSEGPEKVVEALAREMGLETAVIAVDEEMPAAFLLLLQEMLPAALFRRGGELIGKVRAIKDETEYAFLLEAAQITDEALASGLELCAPGHTEWGIALAIQRALQEVGSTLAFGVPIIASGENSSRPHYTTGHRVLKEHDVVVMDFGGVREGYCNDITRTVCIGSAPPEVRKVYQIVYDAHYAAREAARPGVPACEVDRAARRVIEQAGYGPYFVHRTGHGIGLSVHEPPYIAETNDQPLQEGHCFTIEPGIYLPGKFGIRIENVVILRNGQCESLNAEPPAEIREIG